MASAFFIIFPTTLSIENSIDPMKMSSTLQASFDDDSPLPEKRSLKKKKNQ